jgi:hypothetical protein
MPTDTQAEAPSNSYRPLTINQIAQMQAAYIKLGELLSSKLTTPTKDAEMEGLKKFLHNSLLAHADEFLGAWVTLNREYQPLLMAVSGILARVDDIRARTAAAQAAQQTEANSGGDSAPSNIIPVGNPNK